jgi:hypothetical protein
MHTVQACEEEETWTTIDTTDTRIAREPAQANPEAGLAPAVHPPARDGVVPPQDDPIRKAARQAAAVLPRRGNTAVMSAARLLPAEAAPHRGNLAVTIAAQHLPAEAALRKDNMADTSAVRLLLAEAALRRGSLAAMSAVPLPAGVALPARAGLRLPPVPAEAEDTVPPAAPPAHPKSARKSVVTVSAFNQEPFSFFRLRWSSLR